MFHRHHGATPAGFVFKWLPRDTDNSVPAESTRFNLAPGASRRFANVLDTVFELDGVAGALLVESDSADLAAMSRTFNWDAGGVFTCYGSVIDNRTSDPTTVLP